MLFRSGGEIDLLTVMQKITEEFGCAYSAAEFAEKFREASIKKLRLFDGTNELLATIRRTGGKLYLLSNAQACFTRGELEKLDLADKFDGIMLSSEIGFKKPSKKFFDIAFEKFGLSPKECVYIGNDLRDDVEGARRAGSKSPRCTLPRGTLAFTSFFSSARLNSERLRSRGSAG